MVRRGISVMKQVWGIGIKKIYGMLQEESMDVQSFSKSMYGAEIVKWKRVKRI